MAFWSASVFCQKNRYWNCQPEAKKNSYQKSAEIVEVKNWTKEKIGPVFAGNEWHLIRNQPLS